MKKVLGKVKKYRMLIVGIVVGLIIFGGGVYAATIGATNVSYSNASSGMYSNTVQGAIDELYNASKKNTNFIKNLATSYAHDVFLQYYNNPCTIDNKCTYSSLVGGIDQRMSSCMMSCMTSGYKDSTRCYQNCMSNYCGADVTAIKNLDQGCSDKCSNNTLCYDTCFSKAVDNDACIEFYKNDSSS